MFFVNLLTLGWPLHWTVAMVPRFDQVQNILAKSDNVFLQTLNKIQPGIIFRTCYKITFSRTTITMTTSDSLITTIEVVLEPVLN